MSVGGVEGSGRNTAEPLAGTTAPPRPMIKIVGRADPPWRSDAGEQPAAVQTGISCKPQGMMREAKILILDEQPLFADSLGYSFRQLGYSVRCEASLRHAFETCLGAHTELIVSELKVSGTSILDCLEEIRLLSPRARIVIATAQPSIASAIRAIRLGVDAYLAKPVSAPLVLESSEAIQQKQDAMGWPSLDRTIWEYLNQVFAASGSMSEAARRLGVDRRSLRRMLAKHPPTR